MNILIRKKGLQFNSPKIFIISEKATYPPKIHPKTELSHWELEVLAKNGFKYSEKLPTFLVWKNIFQTQENSQTNHSQFFIEEKNQLQAFLTL